MQTILHTLFLEYLQMKARIVYLATLMMAMLAIMSACNNDDFPEISEGLKDNSVVIKSLSSLIKLGGVIMKAIMNASVLWKN